MDTDFSNNGKYFAQLTKDGKLKIWDTLSNRLEQEFTPDYHLTTPCTCLKFFEPGRSNHNNSQQSPKPRKKKKLNHASPEIILGTSSGLLLCYSISESKLRFSIDSNTSQRINCISLGQELHTIHTGNDKDVIEWNLQKKSVASRWKAGNEKITAMLAIQSKLLTASRSIKVWDLQKRQLLRTFTGHSSEITCMKLIRESYFITGSKNDRLLNCWNLSDENEDRSAIASFLMEDLVQNISSNVSSEGSLRLAATIKNGSVHIYQHTLNGKCIKPIKPNTTIQVVQDVKEASAPVLPIHVMGATFRDESTISIGHGTYLSLTFENIVLNYAEKLQCLLRASPHAISSSSATDIIKTKIPIVGEHVHYLSQSSTSVTSVGKKRSLGQGKPEVPMEQRLENLKLNQLDSSSSVPKANNVAQLLVQGLHSKDKLILQTVLCKREEEVIRNTLSRLPLPVIPTLIEELAGMLSGKTLMAQIAVLWLKCLLQTHVSILLSNPALMDLLQPVLASLETRLSLQTKLNKFKGRLDFLLRQTSGVNSTNDQSTENEPLLVYNGNDNEYSSSDEQMDLDKSNSGDEMDFMDSEEDSEKDGKSEDSEEDGVQDNDNDADLQEEDSD